MRGMGHEFFTDVKYFEQHPLVQGAVKELQRLEETQAKKGKRRGAGTMILPRGKEVSD